MGVVQVASICPPSRTYSPNMLCPFAQGIWQTLFLYIGGPGVDFRHQFQSKTREKYREREREKVREREIGQREADCGGIYFSCEGYRVGERNKLRMKCTSKEKQVGTPERGPRYRM